MIIESASITKHGALVDSTGRVWARSVELTRAQEAVELGDAWTLNTGKVGLTSTSASAVAYFKNNSNRPFIVDNLIFAVEEPDSGVTVNAGSIDTFVVKNPTAISTSTDFDIIQNRKSSSPNVLPNSTECIKGAEAATLTGGENWGLFFLNENSRTFAPLDFEVSTGDSFGVTMTPRVTAGTLNIYVVISGHFKSEARV